MTIACDSGHCVIRNILFRKVTCCCRRSPSKAPSWLKADCIACRPSAGADFGVAVGGPQGERFRPHVCNLFVFRMGAFEMLEHVDLRCGAVQSIARLPGLALFADYGSA